MVVGGPEFRRHSVRKLSIGTVLLALLALTAPASAAGKHVRPVTGHWSGTEPETATPLSFRVAKRDGRYVVNSLSVKVREYCNDISQTRDGGANASGLRVATSRFHGHTVRQSGSGATYTFDVTGSFHSKRSGAVTLSIDETPDSQGYRPTDCSTGRLTFHVRHG
jgi:hypothetical protein